MKKSRVSTVILIIVFLVGLSLLLYPSLSDYWNSFRQSRAIASYVESVSHLDNQEYQALLEEARAYNASLVGDKTRFSPTEEELAEYLTLLGSTGAAVGYVEIPAIKLTLPIYLGTSETVLQVGVGTMEGSSLPIGGESTHAVLTGHRGLPSATLFTDLDRLVQGDMFHIHILNETCTYEVDQIQIVEGEDYCTLVTCTPYGVNSHRMLVRGHRIETPEDAVFVQVSPDALQMDPLFIAPFVAVPILLVLLLFLLFGGQKRSAKSNSHQKAQAKKGGNSGDDDQKVDR